MKGLMQSLDAEMDVQSETTIERRVSAPGEELVAWSSIRVDGGTQMRAGLNRDTVAEYTDAMNQGDTFPPVDLYYDGSTYWLGDGFHRHAAHKQAHGISQPIRANVKPGTRRDAVLAAAAANAKHGLQRTVEDKRRAVDALLADDEWGKWGDREIARRTATTHPFVRKRRAALVGDTGNVTSVRKYMDKYGNERTMETKNIGASTEPKAPESEAPPADTGEVADDGPSPLPTLDEVIATIWNHIKSSSPNRSDADADLLEQAGRLHHITIETALGIRGHSGAYALVSSAMRCVAGELYVNIERANRDAERRAQHEQQQHDQVAAPASDEQPETPSLRAARLINSWPHDSIMLSFTKVELMMMLDNVDVVAAVIDQLADG